MTNSVITVTYLVDRVDYRVSVEGHSYDKVFIRLSDCDQFDSQSWPLGLHVVDCVLVPREEPGYAVSNVYVGDRVEVSFTFIKGACDTADRYRLHPVQLLYGVR